MLKAGIWLFLVTVSAGVSTAANITFTATGSFNAGTPVTSVSAPGAFTFSFSLPVNPSAGPGVFASDFSVSEPATLMFGTNTVNFGPTAIGFYSSTNGGGFDALFTHGTDTLFLGFSGPQLFTGSTSNPTILPISFTATAAFSGYAVDNGSNIMSFTSAPIITASPEPNTGMSFMAACLVLSAVLIRRAQTRKL